MNSWPWNNAGLSTIQPNDCAAAYVEYNTAAGKTIKNDGGEVEYTLEGSSGPKKFQVQARASGNEISYDVWIQVCVARVDGEAIRILTPPQIAYTDISTIGFSQGSTRTIGVC